MVTTGRHPFEIAVLLAAVVCGIALIVTGVSTRSVATAMPGVIQGMWHVLLVAGGAVGLIGVLGQFRLEMRLGFEVAGVVVLGTAATMYAIALIAVSGSQAIPAGSFIAAVAVASWARAWQIVHDLRRAVAAANQGRTAEVPLLVEGREP